MSRAHKGFSLHLNLQITARLAARHTLVSSHGSSLLTVVPRGDICCLPSFVRSQAGICGIAYQILRERVCNNRSGRSLIALSLHCSRVQQSSSLLSHEWAPPAAEGGAPLHLTMRIL